MPVPHLEIRIVQRSKGGSAVAGAAYQAGEKLFSEYDQKSKDHRRKQHEVVYTEIMLPSHAPPEYADRATLWNSAEEVEKQWKDELDSFNRACRYLKKQGVDLNVDLVALQAEYDTLQSAHTELAGQLTAVKEELQPMKDIRYWVGKVLTPEQTEAQKKPEPKHSITERLKYEQEQRKQTQEQKTPKQKIQNMEL